MLKNTYLKKGINNILYLDIETSDLDDSMAYTILWRAQLRNILTGKITKHGDTFNLLDKKRALRKKLRGQDFDYRIIKSLFKLIKKCDLVVGHFSNGFDMPFARSKAFYNHLEKEIPKYKTVRYADTYFMSKHHIGTRRYGLENMIYRLSLRNGKNHINRRIWRLAREGDKWAIRYIANHCIKDVDMLRRLHMKIEPFFPITSRFI